MRPGYAFLEPGYWEQTNSSSEQDLSEERGVRENKKYCQVEDAWYSSEVRSRGLLDHYVVVIMMHDGALDLSS
jgi:hypothetical protein